MPVTVSMKEKDVGNQFLNKLVEIKFYKQAQLATHSIKLKSLKK